jgi:S-adenosylmethionine-diacylglycerol 3-amino-3-carboxypropyl transferase
MSLSRWVSVRTFQWVHGHNLVYNTCWEDPRLDRVALDLGPDDTVLVITSAGCNALDYALTAPRKVIAVDMNPRQNALLELKLAGIRRLDYPEFFAMFGRGRLDRAGWVYTQKLREALSPWAQRYWDRWIEFFEPGNLRPFHFRGTSGAFALLMNFYVSEIVRLKDGITALLAAETVEEQRRIYEECVHDRFWSKPVRFLIRRDGILSMLGVPRAQRDQIDRQYPGGIAAFVHDCLEAVFTRLPLSDNYFWRVYMTGRYRPDCCPEYLKPGNFQRLKEGLVDRVEVHTDTVGGFLEKHETPISRFVLLDHMDWLAGHQQAALQHERQWIVRRATPRGRAIWRSAGLHADFVDRTEVTVDGASRSLGELLSYHRALAERLHGKCRVHTYGSFHIADLAV